MLSVDLESCLAAIPDRRRAEGKMYSQGGVILFSIIAMLSGARSYRQIHALIDRRLALLNAAFPTAALRRAPAYTSVRGILQRIDPDELERAFRRHAEALDRSGGAGPSRFIAIDGKTLRQSFDAFHDRKAVHVLSAFAVDHQIILAHEVVEEKSNEIPAVQTLIATLGLTGRVFTLDAMHCQKNIRDCPRHRQ
ncbi:ISAs1 family transposase [Blastochloris sulfoviridis]|uniref:ISAs1 family transposase n=1 Tax=Blastochloris sulfoviridis TaxID=50712 RepID=UPI001AEEE713|nr:ISAs1 family transposase [Blastochloris sulfoviridis]